MAARKHISVYENNILHEKMDYQRVFIVQGYADINLDLSPGIYTNCSSYDTERYSNLEGHWHQIMVYHGGTYRKCLFFRQFLKYFSNSYFNPVCYQTGLEIDQFLIRLTKIQMDILFSNHLKLLMHDGKRVSLTVKINVAKAHSTHIDPLSKIKSVIKRQLTRCERIEDFNVLNLNNFDGRSPDIFISMSNLPTFELICQTLVEDVDVVTSITGFKLVNNFIKTLKPLSLLKRINVGYLDLSANEIDQIEEVYHLQSLPISVLKILDNPIKGIKSVSQKISAILPNIKIKDLTSRTAFSQIASKLPENNLIPIIPTVPDKNATKIVPKLPDHCYETGNFIISNYSKSTKWHKIIVLHNGRCTKDSILKALFELCEDTEFYPCYYQVDKLSDSFLVRNCLDAINTIKHVDLKLVVDNMIIPMRVQMNSKDYDKSEIDPPTEISTEINERYNLIDKSLNLSEFRIEKSANNLFINIANTKILTQLMILAARKFGSSIQHINLARNGIKSTKGLFPLINMKSLRSINLSDNKLEEYHELLSLIVNIKITDLRLENNPFCKNIDGVVYVKEIKHKLPTLEKLDGYIINEYSLTFNKNYLCDLEYYDFIQKFIKNYFRIFDSQMRYQIIDFYHTKAIYAMSMNFNSKITAANSARINKYNAMSRNILKCSDFRQYATNLLIGNKIIASYFSNLPNTEHDYNSFSIDVTHADEDMICITLSGMVKELGSTLLENEMWFGFTRTFVLKARNKNAGFLKGGIDYTIYNEHMHIFSLNILQTKKTLQNKQSGNASSPTTESSITNIPRKIDVKYENECLTKIFMEVTRMKMNWSVRCLSRMDRKLLPAIEYFLRLEQLNKIPKIAYNYNRN